MIKKLGGLFGRNPTFNNVTVQGVLNTLFGAVGSGSTLTADTDTSLAANSDSKVATQKAIKAYVDGVVTGLLDFKGGINCSANPNYPAALKGDAYVVTAAGKIGGASGIVVAIGDMVVASADNAGGTQAAVGASWFALEKNLDGALLSANNLSDLASAATARTNLGLGSAATTASTDYAVAAKGVTNGDSHDHNGGDGAQIAYGTLSGLPTLGTMASQNASAVAVTGGAIDGATVGATTAAAGKFTTLQAAGDMTVTAAGKYIKNSTANVDQTAFLSNSTGTGANFFQLVSGGGTYTMGMENSSSTYWGTPAYSFTISMPSTRSFALFAGGVGSLLTASAVTQDVTVNMGNLVIGTSGKGIDFSITPNSGGAMSSELFADYEEGTFTPTITGSGGAITLTYTTQTGNYTKIGDTVFVRVYIKVNTVTVAGSGFLVINTGLWNVSAQPTVGSATVGKIAHTDYVTSQMRGSGSSSIVLMVASAAGAPSTVNATDIVSGSEIYAEIAYKV